MAKKTKSKRRRSVSSTRPKLPLKQRILRRAIRVLPFVMYGVFTVGILGSTIVIGMLGWSALIQRPVRKPNTTSSYRQETRPSPVNGSIEGSIGVTLFGPDNPIAMLPEANRLSQLATRQNVIKPTGYTTASTGEASSARELMHFPTWDPKSRKLVEHRVFEDGHQETIRPSTSSPSQGVSDVIRQQIPSSLQSPLGMPGGLR